MHFVLGHDLVVPLFETSKGLRYRKNKRSFLINEEVFNSFFIV